MKSEMDRIKDQLSVQIFGMTIDEAHEKHICLQCQRPALDHCTTEAGIAEYAISGLCEECFDSITK